MTLYDPREIEATLHLAAGDDAMLREELEQVFRASLAEICAGLLAAPAGEHAGLLHRLRGLASSFGAISLQQLAEELAAGDGVLPVSLLQTLAAQISAPTANPSVEGR